MRRWREGCLVGLWLAVLPRLAHPEPQPALPQDFLSTFQAVDAAYTRKDLEDILNSYAPNCTFIVAYPEFRWEYKDAAQKLVKGKSKTTRQRHDVAWQRQELQRLFFVTSQPLEKTYSLALQSVRVASTIQQSFVNRTAREVHLTIEREIRSDQGQVQSIQYEVDEEIWSKGAQGWKLKRRTIHPKGTMGFVG